MSFSISFELKIACPALDSIAKSIERISRAYSHEVGWPTPPNPTGTLEFRSTGDPTMPRLFVTLPQVPADHPEASDVVSGELTLTIGAAEPQVVATTLGQVDHEIGEVAEETLLQASFVFVDNAGNKSTTPLAAEYTVADVTPPPDAVDGLGFRLD